MSWVVSITRDVGCRLEALEQALGMATPAIFNSDQGAQFPSVDFITKDIEAANGDETLRLRCLGPLEKLRSQVDRQESIAHITQAEYQA